jgi:hypothetical protein
VSLKRWGSEQWDRQLDFSISRHLSHSPSADVISLIVTEILTAFWHEFFTVTHMAGVYCRLVRRDFHALSQGGTPRGANPPTSFHPC